MTNRFRKALATVLAVPATVFIAMIRLYQIVLSPDHSWLRHLYPYGYCRHEPTCSAYSIEQLNQRSFPVALWKIFARVISCNPWKKPSEERLRQALERSIAEKDDRAKRETDHLTSIPGMAASIRKGMAEPVSKCAVKVDL